MFSTCIDLELGDLRTTERVLWQHSADCLFDSASRMGNHHVRIRCCGQTAWITRVTERDLVGILGASKRNFRSIDDDDEVTGIHVWSKRRLVLSSQ